MKCDQHQFELAPVAFSDTPLDFVSAHPFQKSFDCSDTLFECVIVSVEVVPEDAGGINLSDEDVVDVDDEEDESEDRLRHKTQKIRIKTPHIDYFPLGGNPTKVAKGTQHLKW